MAEEVQNTPQAAISVPDIMFHMRQRVEKKGKKKKGEDANPYEWVYNKSSDLFAGKKVVVVGLPGAFTPTCTNAQLPGFEELAQSCVCYASMGRTSRYQERKNASRW